MSHASDDTPVNTVTSRELMARSYRRRSTPQLHRECVAHATLPLDARPPECGRCLDDLRENWRERGRHAEWLNSWRDDALDVLTRQDAALMLLTRYEARQLVDNPRCADVVTEDLDGHRKVLVEGVPLTQAEKLVDFFLTVGETAEGIIPLVNLDQKGLT